MTHHHTTTFEALPLPHHWDGVPLNWLHPWNRIGRIFLCNRTSQTSPSTAPCSRCGTSARDQLVRAAALGATARRITLYRCCTCGADTARDWQGHIWDLDPEDYAPAGSWAAEETLFDLTTATCRTCGVCARSEDLIPLPDGTHHCRDTTMCHQRTTTI